MPLIEFVCSYNCGRSKPSAILANVRLEQIGENDRFQAISSGSSVDDINAGRVSLGMKKYVLEASLRDNLFGEQSGLVKNLVEGDFEAKYKQDETTRVAVDEFYARASKHYTAKEKAHRLEALKGVGLENRIVDTHEQTIPRYDVFALYAMAQRNLDQVGNIYAQKVMRLPTIFKVLDVPDAFAKPDGAYQAMFEALQDLVPKAVDEAVSRYPIKRG